MPNFLAQMTGKSEHAPQSDGIEGALQRHAGIEDREEREDDEDEAPLVVDEAEALTAKERRKFEAKPGSSRSGGSLKFKDDDDSAAAKFTESAHDRVMAEERRRAEAEREAAAEAEGEAEAAAAGKKVLFKAGGVSQQLKSGSKRSKLDASSGAPRAKAVKNTKLLSFDEVDE